MDTSKRQLIGRIAQIIIGLVYLAAGIIKSVEPVVFSYEIRAFIEVLFPFIQGEGLALLCLYLAFFFIALELCLGLALIINFRSDFIIPLAGVVMLGFIGVLVGAWDQVENCGCFGSLFDRTPMESAIEDSIFVLIIGIAWWGRRGAEKREGRLYYYPLLFTFIFAVGLSLYFAQRPNFFANLKVGMDLTEELRNQVSDIDVYQVSLVDSIPNRDSVVVDTLHPKVYYQVLNPTNNDTVSISIDRYKSSLDDQYDLSKGDYLIFLISPTCDHCRGSVPVINRYYMQYVIGMLPARVIGLFPSLHPEREDLVERDEKMRLRYRNGGYEDKNGRWYTEDQYGPFAESALFPIGYLDRTVHADLVRVVPRVFAVRDGKVLYIWDEVPMAAELAEAYPDMKKYLPKELLE